jgi:hypothetical protein
MSTRMSQEQVSEVVVDLFRGLHQNESLDENSRFEVDIFLDKNVKKLYYYAIRLELERMGYILVEFSPEDCVRAETIRDIVQAVWAELQGDDLTLGDAEHSE